MEHIAAFLLIIGCSEDYSQCREIPAPLPVFETIEDCDAELAYSRPDMTSPLPKLLAGCFEVDPLLAETDAEIVWDVSVDGELVASVEPIGSGEVLVASTDSRRADQRDVRR